MTATQCIHDGHTCSPVNMCKDCPMRLHEKRVWEEYDSAANWCAAHNVKGVSGDPLPALISVECVALINADIEAFQLRVRNFAYAAAMGKLNLSEQ